MKKKFAVLSLLLALTFQMFIPSQVQAGYATGTASSYYWVWDWNGHDWKIVFYIPQYARGYQVTANGSREHLVVGGSSFEQHPVGNMTKVIMTTGAGARLYAGYEYQPHNNSKLVITHGLEA